MSYARHWHDICSVQTLTLNSLCIIFSRWRKFLSCGLTACLQFSSRFQKLFEHCQVFFDLSFHLFFQHVLIKFNHINHVCLGWYFYLCVSSRDIKRVGSNRLQWSWQRFESISIVWFVFDHLEGALGSMPHPMTVASKTGPNADDTFRDLGGSQRSVLPLKIVLRCANEFKNPFDGLGDKCAWDNMDHLSCSYRVPLLALTLQIVIKPYRRSISVAGESKTQFPLFTNQMLCFQNTL